MKGEIFERAKHIVLDINEHTVKTAWEILNDGLAIEIAWEALNLLELYIILRIVEYILQIVEYLLLEVRTGPIDLIEQRSGQGMRKLGGLLERGKSQLWQIFRIYHILETAVLHQLDQKIIYPHYDFKHLTEKYFEIGMKLNDFSIQLVKYCIK